MKRKIIIAVSWILVLLCMTVIFMLSSQDAESSAKLSGDVMGPVGKIITFLFGEAGHNIFRKFAHFFEYAGLSFLMYNAFYQSKKEKRSSPILPYIMSVLYAVTDEIHQYFVPGRACMLFDIGVDALGALLGIAVFFVFVRTFIAIKERHGRKMLHF